MDRRWVQKPIRLIVARGLCFYITILRIMPVTANLCSSYTLDTIGLRPVSELNRLMLLAWRTYDVSREFTISRIPDARSDRFNFVNRRLRLSARRSTRGRGGRSARAPEAFCKLQFMCRAVSGMRICYAG